MLVSTSILLVLWKEYCSDVITKNIYWSLNKINNFNIINKILQPYGLYRYFIVRNKLCLYSRCSNYKLYCTLSRYSWFSNKKDIFKRVFGVYTTSKIWIWIAKHLQIFFMFVGYHVILRFFANTALSSLQLSNVEDLVYFDSNSII